MYRCTKDPSHERFQRTVEDILVMNREGDHVKTYDGPGGPVTCEECEAPAEWIETTRIAPFGEKWGLNAGAVAPKEDQ